MNSLQRRGGGRGGRVTQSYHSTVQRSPGNGVCRVLGELPPRPDRQLYRACSLPHLKDDWSRQTFNRWHPVLSRTGKGGWQSEIATGVQSLVLLLQTVRRLETPSALPSAPRPSWVELFVISSGWSTGRSQNIGYQLYPDLSRSTFNGTRTYQPRMNHLVK